MSAPELRLEVHGSVDAAVQVGRLVLRLPAPFPAHPPSRAARGPELAALWRAASEPVPPPGIVVSGPSGYGKSTLALQWAYQAHGLFPGGLHHVDLSGPQAAPPWNPPEGERTLLILDNARGEDGVRSALPSAESCFVLVTCRAPLPSLVIDGFRSLTLTAPPSPSAPLTSLLPDLASAPPGPLADGAFTTLLQAAQAEAEDTGDHPTRAAASLRLARLHAAASHRAASLHCYALALDSYARLGDSSSYATALREAAALRPPPQGTVTS
ncbi:hypothetical protein LO762_26340 [Actinocorallia sp. API 0066]|uniref:hypothetical protein n=1 Tax=Actinocorallia sp. API 0066 TaxID=2896846 RepID=UPI001E402D6E|nr:hypothetical protein [Actinocorallia sp. API 0066]MCD0452674.1 hypothetical protein [Actinocorallia sp. API 0066]